MCRILSITLFYQNISGKKFQFAFNFDTKMKYLPYFRLHAGNFEHVSRLSPCFSLMTSYQEMRLNERETFSML
ncbi:hypothetical protein BIZ35_17615 [Heyndrickxia coagulans]|nr:hypothetical protein BIZ35_17615 [Heyndrickxia coagulans]